MHRYWFNDRSKCSSFMSSPPVRFRLSYNSSMIGLCCSVLLQMRNPFSNKFNVSIYILSLYFYNSIKFTDCILIKQFHFNPNREKCRFFLFASLAITFMFYNYSIVFCFVFFNVLFSNINNNFLFKLIDIVFRFVSFFFSFVTLLVSLLLYSILEKKLILNTRKKFFFYFSFIL